MLAALAILFAFALAQIGRLPIGSRRYLAANAVGAGILAVSAYAERQWGFFVLETSWAAVSVGGLLVRIALSRETTHRTLVVAEAPHRVSLTRAQGAAARSRSFRSWWSRRMQRRSAERSSVVLARLPTRPNGAATGSALNRRQGVRSRRRWLSASVADAGTRRG